MTRDAAATKLLCESLTKANQPLARPLGSAREFLTAFLIVRAGKLIRMV